MTDMPTMRAAFRTTVSGGGKYEMVFRFPTMDAMHAADDEWRATLPIPEAPASVEPVADDVLTCDVKLPPATTVRAGCSFETLRLAMSAPGRPRHFDEAPVMIRKQDGGIAALVIPEATHPEPDTIGSHFGDGGGFDPVVRYPTHEEMGTAPPSPGFGGGDLREALRAAIEWIDAIPSEIVASLPVMPGFDRDWLDEIATLPPVKQSVGEG